MTGEAHSETVRQETVRVGNAGVVTGLFLSGLYLLWALFVVSGLAQSLMDFIADQHLIRPVYVIEQIDPSRLATLALLIALVGYAAGGAFAILWNRTNRSAGRALDQIVVQH
jgi:hypothetical protein